MNYAETIAYIDSLSPTLEKPSLDRIAAFLEEHGNPQEKFPYFHIGGTNGKGSTVAMLESILRAAGLKTGRFTGPHLLRWNERFHIGGVPISDAVFAEYASRVRQLSEAFGDKLPELGPLTWFEFLTAIAFFYFADQKIDIAVIEVGLGGRFDATNVLKRPVAVGITNVSLDHVHILGDTVEKIAFEKAGIIKPFCPLVTGARNEAFEVIQRRASKENAPLLHIENNHATVCNGETSRALFEQDLIETVEFSGDYQSLNSQIALALLYVSNYLATPGQKGRPDLPVVTKAHVREGLQKTYWPGRLQWIASENLLLDGAHNTEGIKALRAVLDQRYPGKPLRFVFGCYANKDGMGMMQNLLRRNDIVYVSEAFSRRVTYDRAILAEHALELGVTSNVLPKRFRSTQSCKGRARRKRCNRCDRIFCHRQRSRFDAWMADSRRCPRRSLANRIVLECSK